MEEITPSSTNVGFNERWGNSAGERKQEERARRPYKEVCGKCGARRIDSQLGLENTPDEYVQNLVEVFREVRRVLRDDGTVWLNLGDSYNSGPAGNKTPSGFSQVGGKRDGRLAEYNTQLKEFPGLKPKDLVGIPWRVAFALQADGWYLRSDIIWAKPNPMPESVRDRPTRSHEYIFMLSKGPRYFWDQEAVREEHAGPLHAPGNNGAERWEEIRGAHKSKGMSGHLAEPDRTWGNPAGRNIRSVWNISTQPYKEAHFATFPEKLVEPCILAGSAEGDLVLDCFAGSGTVGVVALRHGRSFIGLELNPSYVELARHRIIDDSPLLNSHIEAVS